MESYGCLTVVDVLAESRGGLGLPFENPEPIVDEIMGFLIVASVEKGEEKLVLIEEALRVFDGVLLPLVSQNLDEAALYLLDYTGIDFFELVDCVGGDTVAESVGWASRVLTDGVVFERPSGISGYATCLGINVDEDMDDRIVASAIFYGFIAALNRMVSNIALEL